MSYKQPHIGWCMASWGYGGNNPLGGLYHHLQQYESGEWCLTFHMVSRTSPLKEIKVYCQYAQLTGIKQALHSATKSSF